MQKKICKSLLLAIVMAMLCIAISMTASAETWSDYEYAMLDDGTIEITKYAGDKIEIEIPSEINGRTVVSIGNDSFRGCTNLTDIIIPDSVTEIGDNAFTHCDHLSNIEISENIVIIGEEAFFGCDSLDSISVDDNNNYYCSEDGVLFNKNKTVLLQYPIGNKRTYYEIPEGVTYIYNYAFIQALNLTSIKFPESLLAIGEQAFDWCFGITTLNIPVNVQEIGLGAFCDLFFLDKIYIENMDVNLGEYISVASEYHYVSGITYEELLPLWKQFLLDEKEYEELKKYLVADFENITWFGTIHCHSGSTAEAYAIENGIDYVLTHFFEGDWTYDYDNMIRYRKCIHCDELETEPLEATESGDVEIIEPADPDTDFVVDEVEKASDNYIIIEEALSNGVAGDFEIIKAFDITMTGKDGVHVQPDGTVKVKLPLDWSKDGIYKVYRVNDDGTLTDMQAYRQGSHMVFDTNHFSIYVIVDESEKTEEAETDFFSKIIDWFKSLIDIILSIFKK